MKSVIGVVITVAMLVAVMLFVGSVDAGIVSQTDVSGTGLVSGSSYMSDNAPGTQNVYNEGLFGVGAKYMGASNLEGSQWKANRLINGSKLTFNEYVGYQGVTKSSGSTAGVEGGCAPQNVTYTSGGAGSSFMVDNGVIQSMADTGANSVGYVLQATGNGMGTVFSNVNTAFGTIPGCGEIGTAVQNGFTQYGSTFTANGFIDMKSLFKFSW